MHPQCVQTDSPLARACVPLFIHPSVSPFRFSLPCFCPPWFLATQTYIKPCESAIVTADAATARALLLTAAKKADGGAVSVREELASAPAAKCGDYLMLKV